MGKERGVEGPWKARWSMESSGEGTEGGLSDERESGDGRERERGRGEDGNLAGLINTAGGRYG